MISSVWLPSKFTISRKSIEDLELIARDAIMQLSMLADTGSEGAAIALRNIGNHAANELENLKLNTFRRRVSEAFPGPFAEQARFHYPVVELHGDLSSITEILEHEEKTIERLTEQAIMDCILKNRVSGRGRFVVNALEALGFPTDLLDEHQRNTSTESVSYKHPDSILEQRLAIIKQDGSNSPQQQNRESTQIAMLRLVHHLLEAQLEVSTRFQGLDLPKKSFEWPMCVSAFSRDVRERFESLDLGASLPFRPNGAKNKTGRPQKFVPGSPIHFAMEYCAALEDVRRSRPDATEDETEYWRDTITRIEADLKKGKIADPDKTFGNDLEQAQEQHHGHSLRILWTNKALLLPEIASFKGKGATGTSGDLKLWLDAAMARARMLCWNDWENYKHWPACVEMRRKHNQKKFRNTEESVRDMLRDGMSKLVAAPKSPL